MSDAHPLAQLCGPHLQELRDTVIRDPSYISLLQTIEHTCKDYIPSVMTFWEIAAYGAIIATPLTIAAAGYFAVQAIKNR